MTSADLDKNLKGLVLAGGKSLRMGSDKSMMEYHGEPQVVHLYHLLQKYTEEVFVSCRASQRMQFETLGLNVIPDEIEGRGPLGAIYSAMRKFPQSAWLVLACDLPLVDGEVLDQLIDRRDLRSMATSFYSPFDNKPEPLIAIWEPNAIASVASAVLEDVHCPRKVMSGEKVHLITPAQPEKLVNVNSPSDLSAFSTKK